MTEEQAQAAIARMKRVVELLESSPSQVSALVLSYRSALHLGRIEITGHAPDVAFLFLQIEDSVREVIQRSARAAFVDYADRQEASAKVVDCINEWRMAVDEAVDENEKKDDSADA